MSLKTRIWEPLLTAIPSGFLASMLEGVEPEVRELCDLFTRGPDTEDAASVLGALLAGKQIVIESTVTTWHVFECRRDRPLVRNCDMGSRVGHRSATARTVVPSSLVSVRVP